MELMLCLIILALAALVVGFSVELKRYQKLLPELRGKIAGLEADKEHSTYNIVTHKMQIILYEKQIDDLRKMLFNVSERNS